MIGLGSEPLKGNNGVTGLLLVRSGLWRWYWNVEDGTVGRLRSRLIVRFVRTVRAVAVGLSSFCRGRVLVCHVSKAVQAVGGCCNGRCGNGNGGRVNEEYN